MDFSEAERGGFIEAFVSFWNRRQDNDRTDHQLRHDAGRILRGCKEHFRSGVTRISRIGGVIPVEESEALSNKPWVFYRVQQMLIFANKLEK